MILREYSLSLQPRYFQCILKSIFWRQLIYNSSVSIQDFIIFAIIVKYSISSRTFQVQWDVNSFSGRCNKKKPLLRMTDTHWKYYLVFQLKTIHRKKPKLFAIRRWLITEIKSSFVWIRSYQESHLKVILAEKHWACRDTSSFVPKYPLIIRKLHTPRDHNLFCSITRFGVLPREIF